MATQRGGEGGGSSAPTGFRPPQWSAKDVEARAKRVPWRAILYVAMGLFLLSVVGRTFIVVQAGERAVVFSKVSGMKSYQIGEGLHVNLPLVWVPTKYDVRSRTYTMSGSRAESHDAAVSHRAQVPDDSLQALTSDGLPVIMDLSVRYHIDPDNVWRLHQNVGPEFVDKIIRPQSRSVTRMAVAQFPVIDVYSGRRQVIIEQITRELRDKFKQNYLILDEVLLRDVRFPEAFQAAIEQKQVAQQEAQQMVFEVERARSEKQQKIVAAEGEAQSIRVKADALAQNPQLVPYEYIKRLPDDVRVVITDSRAIVNLGDVLSEPTGAAPRQQQRRQPQTGTEAEEEANR